MVKSESGGRKKWERESWYRFSRQSACVSGWADGGSGWHWDGMSTSAGRHEHHDIYLLSPPPSHSSQTFPFALSLPLSLLTQHIQSSALISTTCPHLPASRGHNNMACSVWPGSTGWMKCTIKETGFSSCHCWTCNLMCRRSAAEFAAAKHNGLITLSSEANCRTKSMALEVCHWVSFKCVFQHCSYQSSGLLFVHSEWRLL